MPAFSIRPGLVLTWDAAPASATVNITFVLAAAATSPADHMCLGAAAAPAGAFHATLGLSDPALSELLLGDHSAAAALLRTFLPPSHSLPVSPPVRLPLTPAARLALESIRRCPFAGACLAMALTARAHDLLLEFLTALSASLSPAAPPPLTRTADDQIRAAAALLAENLEEPPTLAALARRVGLSETTLKRGFHQVFGTTVFGYLRTRRMARAHALLQSGDATVLEAAALVGYSNPSNFAAAFRREFGLNPKAFQLTARR